MKMTFKKTEKEIIRAIVIFGEKENSMAKVLNKSKLLENVVLSLLLQAAVIMSFLTKRNMIGKMQKR